VCSCDMIVTEPLAVKVSSEAKSLQNGPPNWDWTLILSTNFQLCLSFFNFVKKVLALTQEV